MKRLAIAVTALVVAGCGGQSATLAQCADSWNATSGEKRYLVETELKVRVARFDGGECALVTNADGVIGGLVERDGHWQSYVEPSLGAGAADEMLRLGPVLFADGNKEPNVTVDTTGNLRPIAGAEIGVLSVDL